MKTTNPVSTSKTIYREPQIEEGKHNVLLQNRCGNRLTLLVHDDHTDLEWVYKPNGFRRKDCLLYTSDAADE